MKIIHHRVFFSRLICIISRQVNPVISLGSESITVEGNVLIGIGFRGFAGQEA
ncbi:hypothetical protein ADICYQ_4651 [Cyclobacterium qasimii M12-11B]|uniref:Uncharacterized protein n=1 Tax=Cyclobacterium qasimii M12-11B TaxID=641524 RepID=S7V9T2_9BACT|nr:hypothetical protein ADICYQ_4651 [Cyclobacterium qasimii M12-11B]